ncbi:hypothetical protein KSD_74380 [Ktedonobacter sp. SOSP1-85]|nr:hypothetical protein KSD_74380 [Ktedonobacter sp. SOSP1-85]
MLVDTTGLLLKVVVHEANIQDRQGVPLLLEPIKGIFTRLKKVWVDQGYTGKGRKWIEQEMGWEVEVVRHAWRARGEWVPACEISRTCERSGSRMSASNLNQRSFEGCFRDVG